jgi:hypothetical protein
VRAMPVFQNYVIFPVKEASKQLGLPESVLLRLSQFFKVPEEYYQKDSHQLMTGDIAFNDAEIRFFQEVHKRILLGEDLESIKTALLRPKSLLSAPHAEAAESTVSDANLHAASGDMRTNDYTLSDEPLSSASSSVPFPKESLQQTMTLLFNKKDTVGKPDSGFRNSQKSTILPNLSSLSPRFLQSVVAAASPGNIMGELAKQTFDEYLQTRHSQNGSTFQHLLTAVGTTEALAVCLHKPSHHPSSKLAFSSLKSDIPSLKEAPDGALQTALGETVPKEGTPAPLLNWEEEENPWDYALLCSQLKAPPNRGLSLSLKSTAMELRNKYLASA